MAAQAPRTTPIAAVSSLLDQLDERGSNRDLDVEIFRLIDDRPVRVAKLRHGGVLENHSPDDALGFLDGQHTYDDWVSEMHEFETDDVEDGRIVFLMSKCGYISKDGRFVERPHLDPIPHFTLDLSDAMSFKHSVFVHDLRLRLTEEPTEFDRDYMAELIDESGVVRTSYRSDTAAKSVVGVVLRSLVAGLPTWRLEVT